MELIDELQRIQDEMTENAAKREKELAARETARGIDGSPNDPTESIVFQKNNNQVVLLPGRKVKLLRRRLGLTQSQLAEKTGLTASTIRAAERGERMIRIKTAVRIAKALELTTPMRLHPALPLFFDEPGIDERGLVATPGPTVEDPLGLSDPTISIVARANGHHVVLLAGRRVELLRRRAHLAQEDLGTRVGLTEKAIGMIEREQRLVRVDTAIRIANVLDVNPSRLHPALPIISPIELLAPLKPL